MGEACLGTAHKPKSASMVRTRILENGRHFTPCPNHLTLKEKLSMNSRRSQSPHDPRSSQVATVPARRTEDDSLGSKIFQYTEDNNKVAPPIENKQLIELMENEILINEGNSWVAPLPFRTSRPRLPNNREQALSFNSLCRIRKKGLDEATLCHLDSMDLRSRSCRAGSTIVRRKRMLVPPNLRSVSPSEARSNPRCV